MRKGMRLTVAETVRDMGIWLEQQAKEGRQVWPSVEDWRKRLRSTLSLSEALFAMTDKEREDINILKT